MKTKAAPSLAADSVPPGASLAHSDRRRLVRTGAASALLFLLAILFGSASRPAPYQSRGDYALTANMTGAFGNEAAYVSPEESHSSESGTPEPAKAPVVEQKAPAATTARVPSAAEAHAEHDIYCNLYASAVTGNVTPQQAAQRQQANGAIVGALGGAVLGAIWGGSEGHSGRSTALGLGAGLLAGVTIGSSNAQRKADDISRRYADAYSTCMTQKDAAGDAQPGS